MSRRLLNVALAEISSNSEQLRAVTAKDHCVVLAGPGSGKTRTLTTAIARALLDDVEEPRSIACITYSNECVLELEERLARLGVDAFDRVSISTVHGFALRHVWLACALWSSDEVHASDWTLDTIASHSNMR
jgi:DNA helicase-2/ATP-dependent DNA helicase PcrA